MTMKVDSGTEVPVPPRITERTHLSEVISCHCLSLEYEEKELEKTPLPREVVLTDGVDHHLLYFFPCTTLALLPVVEEKCL